MLLLLGEALSEGDVPPLDGMYHRGIRYLPATDIGAKRPACPPSRPNCPLGVLEQPPVPAGRSIAQPGALPRSRCAVSRNVLRARDVCLSKARSTCARTASAR
jgi:hypothetical protein